MKKIKVNLLAKFLISYVLVLLLPIVSILLYYYPHSTKAAKEKEMEWNAHVTEQFMTSLDIFTRYVYDLPSELMRNGDMRMYMAMEDDYRRIVIANEMRKYNATDAFIYNTLLYVKNIGYLFAKTGSVYSVDDFANRGVGYYYESWPHNEMFQELDKLTLPSVRPAENVIVPGNNGIRMLTFMLPMPLGGEHSPASVLILVKEETIIRMMNAVSESYNGEFYIFDQKGNKLVASKEAAYSETDDFRQMVKQLGAGEAGSTIQTIDGKSYIVSHNVSDKNGWQYVSMLPVTESLQDIRSIQWNTILILLLILFIEGIVIYISIRKNYHPIKRLVGFATEVFKHKDSSPGRMNEIDTIRYALDELSLTNTKLDERVQRTLPILRDNVLFELVSGHYATWEAFHSQGADYGVFKNRDAVTAAVLSFDASKEDREEVSEFLRQEEQQLPETLEGHFFASIYNQEWIFVCSHQEGVAVKTYLSGVQSKLKEQLGREVLIGIGLAESGLSPEGMHLSYLQAVRAGEYLRIRQQDELLAFGDIEISQNGMVSYFAELLQSLEMAILKNEPNVVQSVLEKIIDYLVSSGMPPHMIRTVYSNTISVILGGLQRFRHDGGHLLRLTDAAFQHRYTIEQMVGIMRESCSKLCDIIRETLPAARVATQEEILAVIAEKGFDANFSLQMFADHFSMSQSGFSYHFKKTIGHNFKEYIDRLRIQKSIQLLRSTGGTLDSIAQQTGYSNTSSFIRSFKKMVGTTPGQYRDSCK
ncbi:helix-turn-helix domain-containing protein [Paenibacillus algorifonticola]|uniref:helix-turn-helix domain-containing protein n=1 Tax=Paenibacillus algorifonticola TaxID=684063 RepID=UPI003D29660D